MKDQEKRELLIKAAVNFGGGWPEGYNSLIFSAEFGEGIYGDCAVEKEKFISVMGDSGVWLWVCTQAEFEFFVQELANKAPDGATHYLPTTTFNKYWFKDSGGFRPVQEIQGKSIVGPACQLNEVDLIPLPKLDPAPWVPEVGQECEFSCTAKGKECEWRLGLIEYLSSSTCVINPYDAHGEFVAHPDTMKFRPIRTEAEIERQALYDSLCELDADLNDYQINCLIEFIQGRDDD